MGFVSLLLASVLFWLVCGSFYLFILAGVAFLGIFGLFFFLVLMNTVTAVRSDPWTRVRQFETHQNRQELKAADGGSSQNQRK